MRFTENFQVDCEPFVSCSQRFKVVTADEVAGCIEAQGHSDNDENAPPIFEPNGRARNKNCSNDHEVVSVVLLAENQEEMQKILDVSATWCSRMRMNVNVDETNVVIFGRGADAVEVRETWNMSDDLALVFRPKNLNFEYHIDTAAAKGKKALGAVITKCRSFVKPRYQTLLTLFTSVILTDGLCVFLQKNLLRFN